MFRHQVKKDDTIKNKKILTIFSIGAFASIANVQSVLGASFLDQFEDPLDGKFDASGFLADNAFGFLPVPIIITDPAVEGGLGAVGLFFHESDEDKEKRLEAMKSSEDPSRYLLTPSVSAVAGAVTGNGSWFTGGGHMGMFKQGDIRYLGFGGYGDVSLDFFGSGDLELPRPIEINTKAAMISNSLKFRLFKSPFFLGAIQQYTKADISLPGLGGSDLPISPEWSDRLDEIIQASTLGEVTTSGLGVSLEYDSRDNNFSPTQGYNYKLDFMANGDYVGSDIDYNLSTLTGLNYWRFNDSWRLALKIGGEFADSDEYLPPYATPSIKLRGIPAMRYQGNNVVLSEVELTWDINNRWSVLAFGGAGRAANTSGELKDASTRASKGLGFRYLIARSYGFRMGLDIARGPEETVFYIQAGSAW